MTERDLAVCAAGQHQDRSLRRDVQAVTRCVVQAGPASSLAFLKSTRVVSGMEVFLICVFPPRLRPAQTRAHGPSAKGPAEVGLEAQVDQRVVKGGGFGKHRRHGEYDRRNCIRIHEGRPHGYSRVRTPR